METNKKANTCQVQNGRSGVNAGRVKARYKRRLEKDRGSPGYKIDCVKLWLSVKIPYHCDALLKNHFEKGCQLFNCGSSKLDGKIAVRLSNMMMHSVNKLRKYFESANNNDILWSGLIGWVRVESTPYKTIYEFCCDSSPDRLGLAYISNSGLRHIFPSARSYRKYIPELMAFDQGGEEAPRQLNFEHDGDLDF